MVQRKIQPAIFIILACFLWASDIYVRFPLTLKYQSHQIIFWENLLGFFIFLPFCFLFKDQSLFKFSLKDLGLILFLGIFGSAVAGYFFNISIQQSGPGVFSFLQLFQPVFVGALAYYLLKERIDNYFPTWTIWAIACGLIISLKELNLIDFIDSVDSNPQSFFMGLGAMVIWGICTVCGKSLLKRNSAFKVFFWRWTIAASITGIHTTYFNQQDLLIPLANEDYSRLFYISAISGCFAMWLYYIGLKKLKATTTSLFELCYPMAGILLSSLTIFGKIALWQVIVLLFFLFGVFVWNKYLSQKPVEI